MGTFYGIGVGPGDPELLTVKAVNTLKQLDILYTPKAHHDGVSFAESIAAPYLPDELQIKRRHFPMVKDLSVKQKSWQEIATEIIQDVKADQKVGFITLGDPSVYSTYSYLANLVSSEIAVQTIAGISSFSQIAAEMSVPLMLDDELLEVIPATAPMTTIEKAIELNDNVVIMKVAVQFEPIYRFLQAHQLLNQSLLVTDAALKSQQTRTLDQVSPTEKLSYFTTLLIKKGRQNDS